ncbi:Uncharacterized protein APZ42_023116 [Daphnia magna]|uniref:Uncharacterized protein n=1 Tax=Daphnia magna TaxID=35525 RepID=A0A164V6P7_9CRUS|nr:Uncharacterized protein APZ42_023116 [Daphnia magna]
MHTKPPMIFLNLPSHRISTCNLMFSFFPILVLFFSFAFRSAA